MCMCIAPRHLKLKLKEVWPSNGLWICEFYIMFWVEEDKSSCIWFLTMYLFCIFYIINSHSVSWYSFLFCYCYCYCYPVLVPFSCDTSFYQLKLIPFGFNSYTPTLQLQGSSSLLLQFVVSEYFYSPPLVAAPYISEDVHNLFPIAATPKIVKFDGGMLTIIDSDRDIVSQCASFIHKLLQICIILFDIIRWFNRQHFQLFSMFSV